MSYQSEPVDLYGDVDEDEYWDAVLGLTGVNAECTDAAPSPDAHQDAAPGTTTDEKLGREPGAPDAPVLCGEQGSSGAAAVEAGLCDDDAEDEYASVPDIPEEILAALEAENAVDSGAPLHDTQESGLESAAESGPATSESMTGSIPNALTAAAPAKTIGYIGSPGNLDNPRVKGIICDVLSGLAACGFQACVGKPNEALSAGAPLRIEDMQTVDVEMFDAVIITPGGPAAGKEAKRFSGHVALFAFIDSANARGCPEWFAQLTTTTTFDLNDLQVGQVVETIVNSSGRLSNTICDSTGLPEERNSDQRFPEHESAVDAPAPAASVASAAESGTAASVSRATGTALQPRPTAEAETCQKGNGAPANKVGKQGSNIVVLDEDELDEEELQALAEVKKKGYYHGRPSNSSTQTPQRLELTESQQAERHSERHAEFDEYQKKWDRFDNNDWAEQEERDFIGRMSSGRVLQPAGYSSSCSSSARKASGKSGVVASNPERKTLMYQCSQSPFLAFGQALREVAEWLPGGLCVSFSGKGRKAAGPASSMGTSGKR